MAIDRCADDPNMYLVRYNDKEHLVGGPNITFLVNLADGFLFEILKDAFY